MAATPSIGLLITEITQHFKQMVDDIKSNFMKLDAAYHVGRVIITTDADWDPNVSLGGHWDRLRGVFLVSDDGNRFRVGQTGGSATHQHLMPMGFDGGSLYGHLAASGENVGNPMWGSKQYDSVYSVGEKVDWVSRQTWCRDAYTEPVECLPPYQVVNMWVRTR